MKNAIFANRQEALQKLADVLMVRNLDFSQSVLLATSLDGAYFADELAKILKIPLEYLFTQTLCAPLNPECQIAIVSEELDIVMHENLIDTFGISLDYIYGEAKRQYEESIFPLVTCGRKNRGRNQNGVSHPGEIFDLSGTDASQKETHECPPG